MTENEVIEAGHERFTLAQQVEILRMADNLLGRWRERDRRYAAALLVVSERWRHPGASAVRAYRTDELAELEDAAYAAGCADALHQSPSWRELNDRLDRWRQP